MDEDFDQDPEFDSDYSGNWDEDLRPDLDSQSPKLTTYLRRKNLSEPEGIIASVTGRFLAHVPRESQLCFATPSKIYRIRSPSSEPELLDKCQDDSHITGLHVLRGPSGRWPDALIFMMDTGSLYHLAENSRITCLADQVQNIDYHQGQDALNASWQKRFRAKFRRDRLVEETSMASFSALVDTDEPVSYLIIVAQSRGATVVVLRWQSGGPGLLACFPWQPLTGASEPDTCWELRPIISNVTVSSCSKTCATIAIVFILEPESHLRESSSSLGHATFHDVELPLTQQDFQDVWNLETNRMPDQRRNVPWMSERQRLTMPGCNHILPCQASKAGDYIVIGPAFILRLKGHVNQVVQDINVRLVCEHVIELNDWCALIGSRGAFYILNTETLDICGVDGDLKCPYNLSSLSAMATGTSKWLLFMGSKSDTSRLAILELGEQSWSLSNCADSTDLLQSQVFTQKPLAPIHKALLIDSDPGGPKLVLASGKAPHGKLHMGFMGCSLESSVCITKLAVTAQLIAIRDPQRPGQHKYVAILTNEGDQMKLLDISGNTIKESELPYLDHGSATLDIVAFDGCIVQILANAIRWHKPGRGLEKTVQVSKRVTLTSRLFGTHMAVASGNHVAIFDLADPGSFGFSWLELSEQVSALHIVEGSQGLCLVVGLWIENALHLVHHTQLPGAINSLRLGAKTEEFKSQPRSIVEAHLTASRSCVLVGTSDGTVHAYSKEKDDYGMLELRKVWTVRLGSAPVVMEFVPPRGKQSAYVYATTDESYLIRASGLPCSPDAAEAVRVDRIAQSQFCSSTCAISTDLTEYGRMWIDSRSHLHLGQINLTQQFHVQTKDLQGVVPKMMEFDKASGCLLVVSSGQSADCLHLFRTSPRLAELMRIILKNEIASALCIANRIPVVSPATSEVAYKQIVLLATLPATQTSVQGHEPSPVSVHALEIKRREGASADGSYTLEILGTDVKLRDTPITAMTSSEAEPLAQEKDFLADDFHKQQKLKSFKRVRKKEALNDEPPSSVWDGTVVFVADIDGDISVVRFELVDAQYCQPEFSDSGSQTEDTSSSAMAAQPIRPPYILRHHTIHRNRHLSQTVVSMSCNKHMLVMLGFRGSVSSLVIYAPALEWNEGPVLAQQTNEKSGPSTFAYAITANDRILACHEDGKIVLLQHTGDPAVTGVALGAQIRHMLTVLESTNQDGQAILQLEQHLQNASTGEFVKVTDLWSRPSICAVISGTLSIAVLPVPSISLQESSSKKVEPSQKPLDTKEKFVLVSQNGAIDSLEIGQYLDPNEMYEPIIEEVKISPVYPD